MDNKNWSGFAGAMKGKGFYLALGLCAVVLGASAWIASAEMGSGEENSLDAARIVDVSDAVVTMVPAGTPLERDDDVPTVTLQDEAAVEMDDAEPEETAVFNEDVTYVWPVHGPVEVPYAVETLHYDSTMADWRAHDGIDIACAAGDEVMAAASGTVTSVKNDDLYGTVVEIDHGNGVKSVYANLAAEPPVSEGEWVGTGQVIGSVGGTALVETNMVPHVHLSMTRDGDRIDPTELLPALSYEE